MINFILPCIIRKKTIIDNITNEDEMMEYISKQLNKLEEYIKNKKKVNNDIINKFLGVSGDSEMLQQPTLLANTGRYSTITRWTVEKAISHVNNRYDIFGARIRGNVIPDMGIMLKYIKNTHNQFNIGIYFILNTHIYLN